MNVSNCITIQNLYSTIQITHPQCTIKTIHRTGTKHYKTNRTQDRAHTHTSKITQKQFGESHKVKARQHRFFRCDSAHLYGRAMYRLTALHETVPNGLQGEKMYPITRVGYANDVVLEVVVVLFEGRPSPVAKSGVPGRNL